MKDPLKNYRFAKMMKDEQKYAGIMLTLELAEARLRASVHYDKDGATRNILRTADDLARIRAYFAGKEVA